MARSPDETREARAVVAAGGDSRRSWRDRLTATPVIIALVIAFVVSAGLVFHDKQRLDEAHHRHLRLERLLNQLILQHNDHLRLVELATLKPDEQYRQNFLRQTAAFVRTLGLALQLIDSEELASGIEDVMARKVRLTLMQEQIIAQAFDNRPAMARAMVDEAGYVSLLRETHDALDVLHWQMIEHVQQRSAAAYATLYLMQALTVALAMATILMVLRANRQKSRHAQALCQAHAKLHAMHHELEQRVEDRTRELHVALMQARASDEAKSAFLANMSHEVRTPLNGILGFASLLQDDITIGPEAREKLGLIMSSGQTLLSLLDDVLDLSRIESGRLSLDTRPFSLGQVLQDLIDRMRVQAASKELDLTLEYGFDVPERVMGDARRLTQVLGNLVSNAIKFTDSGSVTLTVEVAGDVHSGELLAFDVTDTGRGFDMADKDRLFRRFERSDDSLTNTTPGSGLGLSITHELVTLMGGTLDCTSRIGHGSTFIVTLPLPEVNAADAAEFAHLGDGPEGRWLPHPVFVSGRPLRILAAEDNQANVLLIQAALVLMHAEVDVVADGEAAFNAWAPGAYDLILMDMQMPMIDGLEATRMIREREQALGCRRTPILCLTANIMPRHRREALAAGCDGHVPKPILPRDLCQTIEQTLETFGVVTHSSGTALDNDLILVSHAGE